MEEATGVADKPRVDARCLPSKTTTWLTPRWILDALGEFGLDPCCPPEMPWRTAKRMIHWPEDGLAVPWEGRVWLNPPYGRNIEKWLDKMVEHWNGVALIFARTDTKWFQEYVFGCASALFFLNKRVRFCCPDGSLGGSPAASSVLVAYGDMEGVLLNGYGEKLGGTYIRL